MSFLRRIFGKPIAQVPPLPALSPEALALTDESMAHLGALMQGHEAGWEFSSHDDWELDQQTGVLSFIFSDGMKAECPAQIIGTLGTADHVWLWSWNNPSVREHMTAHALKLQEFGREEDIAALRTPTGTCDADTAWRMTSLAVKLCDAQGAYCASTGAAKIYFTFSSVKLLKPKSR